MCVLACPQVQRNERQAETLSKRQDKKQRQREINKEKQRKRLSEAGKDRPQLQRHVG